MAVFAAALQYAHHGIVKTEVLLRVDVSGRPASYSSAAEAPWKAAVRAAISEVGGGPWIARFSVLIEFRTPQARNPNEVWDLDNLINRRSTPWRRSSDSGRGRDLPRLPTIESITWKPLSER